MATTEGRRSHTALDAALDIFRVRQYFNVVVGARDVVRAVRADARFLDTVRRGLLPLPFDRQPASGHIFGPLRGPAPPPLAGRVGVVATGGSGALASLIGVAKALEDSGTEVSVYSVCSGSALFGFPLGAGMSPEEAAELTASMRPGDYVDVGWSEIAALVPTLARGWCGILRGDKLEAFYRCHLGDLTLAQLRTPTYAPIWNVEHNRLDFLGPRTHPDMPVARAIRMAVSLPLFVQPVVLDGQSWCDGGIVDIFPVRPVLDIEPAVEVAVAVNGFYPHEFGGEDVTGWDHQPLSIVPAASQVRTCQQAELAREHLDRLRREARTLLVEPVPYWKVAGTGFYEQFLDTREWPEFMRAGRVAMLASLRHHAPRAAA
ncbi:MAG TPA: patatin-like phospholipase family protein [Streptosporangiaceae bacterium]|nr:patatin-like phospholipase family protein [Streptosporangiaceae bacterium]